MVGFTLTPVDARTLLPRDQGYTLTALVNQADLPLPTVNGTEWLAPAETLGFLGVDSQAAKVERAKIRMGKAIIFFIKRCSFSR